LRRSWWIALLLVLMTMFAPLTIDAQAVSYAGLDIVFLIDQSGSMGGKAFSNTSWERPGNDPNGIRFQATQFGIDWLGNFRAQQALFGNDLDINTSVIYFGDRAEIRLAPAAIIPGTLEDWQTERTTLLEPLSEDSYSGQNLGDTDFIDALASALEVLPNNPERLQAIILLTDGEPCSTDRDQCGSIPAWRAHMREVIALQNSEFNATNQLLYAVALVSERNWSEIDGDWATAANNGFARRLERPDEFGVIFNQILTGLGQQLIDTEAESRVQLAIDVRLPQIGLGQAEQAAERGQTEYPMPPYQQLMSLTLFKSRQDARLVLKDPAGTTITSQSDGVNVYGEGTLIEIWQITNPLPGSWTIGTIYSGADGRELADPYGYASLDLLQARFQLNIPRGAAPMLRPVTMAVEALDAQDRLLPLYDQEPGQNYRLTGNITLRSPSGEVIPLAVTPEGSSSRYSTSFTPFSAGAYTVETTVSAQGVSFSATETLNVSTTNVVIEGVRESILESTDQVYMLRFMNAGGAEIPDITTETFEISMIPAAMTCEQPGNTVERLPTPTNTEETLQILAQHSTIGTAQRMCVRVIVRDTAPVNGVQSRTVFNGEYAQVTVRPVQPITFRLIRPQEIPVGESRSINLTTYVPFIPFLDTLLDVPGWETEPIEIAVELVDKESGEALPNMRSLISADDFFTLGILDGSDDNILPDGTYLATTDNPARWSLTLQALPPGEYDLVISAVSGAVGDTDRAVLSDDRIIRLPFTITANVAAQTAQASIVGATGLIGITLFTLLTVLPVWRTRNPVKGTLMLVRQSPDGKLYRVTRNPIDFTQNNLRKVKVPLRDLPVVRPPLTGMTVHSNRKDSVFVDFEVNGVKTPKLVPDNEPIDLGFNDKDGNKYFVIRNRFIQDGERWNSSDNTNEDTKA